MLKRYTWLGLLILSAMLAPLFGYDYMYTYFILVYVCVIYIGGKYNESKDKRSKV